MMRTSDKLKDAVALEHYRVVLSKTETYPKIAKALERIGYGPEILEEGREVLRATREVYENNLKIKDDQSFARAAFLKQKELVDRTFRDHRNKARLLFRDDDTKADILAVSGIYPRQHDLWIETIRKFYKEARDNQEIQEKLLHLRITKEDVEAGLAGLEKLEHLDTDRMRLKGVSKDSTKKKLAAFARLHEWMRDFFTAAKLAMKKEPELLEALLKPA